MSDKRSQLEFDSIHGSEAPLFDHLQSRQVAPLFLGWVRTLPESTTPEEMWAACREGSWLLEYVRECGFHHDEHGRAKLLEVACVCSKLALRHVFRDDLAAYAMIDNLDLLCEHTANFNWTSAHKEEAAKLRMAMKQQETVLRACLMDAISDRKHAIDALMAAAATAEAALEAIETTRSGSVIGWKTWHLSWRAVVEAEKIGGMKHACVNAIKDIIPYTRLATLT